ncbi:hypothetical protein [Salibacter halophilus]|uniref:Outer membrane beta-barrel protein n=1 Tax=Salibacter halophilus TaxID=1803916 RepID=A0A6N6M9E1_9FLAO|nr:hypothetical protein [Salibacter halophilus]KAB1064832.1 hypothetical protein F3059_05610 [Salibacter halophilus]
MRNFVLVLLAVCSSALAFSGNNLYDLEKKRIGLAFEITKYPHSFGYGGKLNAPFFDFERMRTTFKVHHLQFKNSEYSSETSSFQSAEVGTVGIVSQLDSPFRFYGEGGLSFLIAPDLTTTPFNVGGYGLFGCEVITSSDEREFPPITYFIEMGAHGNTGKIEKKLPKQDRQFQIASGLSIKLGVNFNFSWDKITPQKSPNS